MDDTKTIGQQLAMSFRPFLSPGLQTVKDVDEAVINMGKAIDYQFSINIAHADVISRVKQLLSALNYEALTDYQAKCVLLLERELEKIRT